MERPRAHTDRSYQSELEVLEERLLAMAERVQEMLGCAAQALRDEDLALAEATILEDHKVNLDEIEIDELCLVLLARRQPMASDLRFITLAMKMITDLERIGDLAVNVCERARDLASFEPLAPDHGVFEMASRAKAMIADSMRAFCDQDTARAREIIEQDDQVDALYQEVFREVLADMVAGELPLERGIHVQSVAKFLERVADHATNLAEQVVFLVKGADLRHRGKLDAEDAAELGRTPGDPAPVG